MSSAAEIRERDAAARLVAQREFTAPLVLQAGAGTGKTAALTARVVAWCLHEGWERAAERVARGQGLVPTSRHAPDLAGLDDQLVAQEERETTARDVLGRIAAITFTEAAAAEMSERIEEAFAAIETGQIPVWIDEDSLCPAGVRAERTRALREALDHLTVRTIHAWCRSLLARFPLAAKLPPDFEVDASGRIQAEVMQWALTEQLREEYSRESGGPLLDLAADECGPTRVYDAALALVAAGVRSSDFDGDPLPVADVRALLRNFRDAAVGLAACAPPDFKRAHRVAAVFERIDDSCALLDAFEAGDVGDTSALDGFCRNIEGLWGSSRAELPKWKKGEAPKVLTNHCGEEEARRAALAFLTPLDSLRKLHPLRLVAVQRAQGRLLAAFETDMAARGAVTFSELLRGARDLLTQHPAVAAQLRAELDQVLVDEFQDTDALQCDIVRAIALDEAGDGERRPGLFVVGDPKQSIYGWRSADLAAFEEFVKTIRGAGGQVLELSVNFRSVPSVLDEVERCIAPVMIEEPQVQPRFQRLVASEANAVAGGFHGTNAEGAPWAPVEHWVSWVQNESKKGRPSATRNGEAAALEAEAFADDVQRLRDEAGVDLSSVALLLRSRGDLERYLAALRERGIPYVVSGEKSYYGRREVIDVISSLRCVLDPNDHIALVGLLRSPAVGVPDAALIPLWARDFPQLVGGLRGGISEGAEPEGLSDIARVLREVVDTMPEVPGLERIDGWEASAFAALRSLGRLRESFETEAPDRFVERMRSEFAAEVSEAGRFPAAFRLANLERFYRDLSTDLAAGADEQALVRRLRTAAASERDADEPVAIVEGAVQVMTIHGAKGLGFEHVYIAQSHKGSGGGVANDAVERVGDRIEFHLLGTDSLGYGAATLRSGVRAAAERVRTLYVAMTRAKSRVVVMGKWPKPGPPKSPELAQSYADLIQSREDSPDLEEAMEAGDSRFEHGSALWRLPSLETPFKGRGRVLTPSVDVPSVEVAAEASAALAEHRVAALARMQRPLREAASRLTHAELWNQRAESDFGSDSGEDVAVTSDDGGDTSQASRDSAMRIGTIVHALLEEWDFEAKPDEELNRARVRLDQVLAREGLGSDPAEEARSILEDFAKSPLFGKFAGLGGDVIARELPVLLPRGVEENALQGTAGAIDLVYRDASGEWVVVDYKTDRVENDGELSARSAAYSAQGRAYVTALHEGLALERPPRFELWFLRGGRVTTPLES